MRPSLGADAGTSIISMLTSTGQCRRVMIRCQGMPRAVVHFGTFRCRPVPTRPHYFFLMRVYPKATCNKPQATGWEGLQESPQRCNSPREGYRGVERMVAWQYPMVKRRAGMTAGLGRERRDEERGWRSSRMLPSSCLPVGRSWVVETDGIREGMLLDN